jgi:hypothetical protein
MTNVSAFNDKQNKIKSAYLYAFFILHFNYFVSINVFSRDCLSWFWGCQLFENGGYKNGRNLYRLSSGVCDNKWTDGGKITALCL